MKTFQGNRTMDDIIRMAEDNGWTVDMTAFHKGGDCIVLQDMHGQVKSNEGIPRQVVFNVTNGHFYVYDPSQEDAVATHVSSSLDHESWYTSLLNLFYLPLENGHSA